MRKTAAALAVAAVCIPVASSDARPAATYTLSASGTALKFNKSTIRAKAGKVTLRLNNRSRLPHNIGVKGKGVSKTVTRGSARKTFRLRRGTYTFYCGVGSHERQGMRGRLIVR